MEQTICGKNQWGSLLHILKGERAGMGLIYLASSVSCIANYRCSINVHYVIELLIPSLLLCMGKNGLALPEAVLT